MDGSFYVQRRSSKEASTSVRGVFVALAIVFYAALMTYVVATRSGLPGVEDQPTSSIFNTWGFGP